MKNNQNIWSIIQSDYSKHPEDYGGRVCVSNLERAERILKLNFSNDYKKFLMAYGSCIMPGHIIYGLIPLGIMGDNITNVIDKTNFYKDQQGWIGIEDWYVISDDGSGNPIGVDPSGKVWLSDHDSGFEKILLADSFEEFLYKLHTETLYE